MKRKSRRVFYFLTTLLLCGLWLHAGKNTTALSSTVKLFQKAATENGAVSSCKEINGMGRFIPSVLLF